MSRFGPCMCGDTECPSCGPLQGGGMPDEDVVDAARYRALRALCDDEGKILIYNRFLDKYADDIALDGTELDAAADLYVCTSCLGPKKRSSPANLCPECDRAINPCNP